MYPCLSPIAGYTETDFRFVAVFRATWPTGYTWDDDYTPGPYDYWPSYGATKVGEARWRHFLCYEHPAAELNVKLPSNWTDTVRVGSGTGAYGSTRPDDPLVVGELPVFWHATLEVCDTWDYQDPWLYAYAAGQWAKDAITECVLPDGLGTVQLAYEGIHVGNGEMLPDPYPPPVVETLNVLDGDDLVVPPLPGKTL